MIPSQPLMYAGGQLDRAEALRRDPRWLAERLAGDDTRVLPVWRNRTLMTDLDRGAPEVLTLTGEAARRALAASSETVFLGLDGDTAVFAVDVAPLSEADATGLGSRGTFTDLRVAGAALQPIQAALAAYGRSMLQWHRRHRHCGDCGHPTQSRDGGHMRICGNPECARKAFPRTDPAVIMLVERAAEPGRPAACLLGRHKRLPPNVYTTLAGFVEPGESLEEAVAREVFEETGVRVENVVYQGSQPWPFPSSIMLGFRAVAATTDIRIDAQELDEARWFSADEFAAFGEWADEDAAFRLPRRDSIACSLILSWLRDVGGPAL